jgi:ParB-like chromosome segregation protein Spo0J
MGASKRVTDRASRVEVIYMAAAELKLDPHNPRQHTPRQIRQIARSIEAFGFNVPVLLVAGDEF